MRLAEPEFSSWNHWSMVSSGQDSRWLRGRLRLPRENARSSSLTWWKIRATDEIQVQRKKTQLVISVPRIT